MDDGAVFNRDSFEASATSLNRQSWGRGRAEEKEEERHTDTTPLMSRSKGKKKHEQQQQSSPRRSGGGEMGGGDGYGARGGKRAALGSENSATYDVSSKSERGLFVKRTVLER